MRDLLFVFWGTLAGLTAIATGIVVAWQLTMELPLAYEVATVGGGLVELGVCLTAQFVVSEVGKK